MKLNLTTLLILTFILSCNSSINVDTATNDLSSTGEIKTLNLTPLGDTNLNVNNTNYVAQETLNLYTWPDNSAANSIVIKFDISRIPEDAIIKKATLFLNMTKTIDSGGNCETNDAEPHIYRSNLYRLINFDPDLSTATGDTYDGTNNWSPSACCYNSFPIGMSDISDSYDTHDLNSQIGWKSFNATELIKDWLNGAPNYGMLLDSDGTKYRDCERAFASSDNSDTTIHPYLEVKYEAF